MKSTRNLSMTIGLAILLLLGFGGASASAAVYDLCVSQGSITMPDGASSVPVWGFGTNNGSGCQISVPGPELTVDPTDPTLQINLTNNLAEPVSLHILGQTLSNNTGPTFTAAASGHDAGLNRVMSFTYETAPGATVAYRWDNFRPGTYLLQSGTNPAKQVQMGLYAVVKKDFADGSAYDSQPYDIEATVVFHDIDPEIHQAVVDGRYGANPVDPANTDNIPSSVYRKPRYFLINGTGYSSGIGAALPDVGAGQRVLLRFVNAGLVTHVPQIPSHYMTLIAEDGNPYTYPRQSYGFELAPAKTMDVIFESAVEGAFAVYDGRLKLTNAGAADMGGMLAFLNVGAGSGVLNPVAFPDAYATSFGTPLAVAAPGVLDNDDPRDATSLEAVLDTGPTNASSFILNSDGSFNYTPTSGFSGNDSFTYRAEGPDGGGATLVSNTVSVSLTVSPGASNTAPVAVNDEYSVDENGSLNINAPGVLGNDSDSDGDSLTAALVSPTTNGTLTLDANGSFTYTPNTNFSGSDSFTYRASDGTAQSNTATASITVNEVTDVVTIISAQYTRANRILVRADSDAPDNSVVLTATLTGSGSAPASKTMTFNAATGDYSTEFNFNVRRFTPTGVTVTSSGGGSATATVPTP